MLKVLTRGTVFLNWYTVLVHTDQVIVLEMDLAHKRCDWFTSVEDGPEGQDVKNLCLLVTEDTPHISDYEKYNAGMLATHVQFDPEVFHGFDIFAAECARYTVRIVFVRREVFRQETAVHEPDYSSVS